MNKTNPIVECEYNLFKEGRTYTGHHRKYVLENAQGVCNDPRTREDLENRELLGYFGHGRRILANKLKLDEVETVKTPDGRHILVENVPSNVTTAFDIKDDGTIRHSQEFLLKNKPGRVAYGLHQDKIGGFSWAMGRGNGGAPGTTMVQRFYGMDYVMNPGFNSNRGFVLESAGEDTDFVLESILKAGACKDEAEARRVVESWVGSELLLVPELERLREDAMIIESALKSKVAEKDEALEALTGELNGLKEQADARAELIAECAGKSIIAIPEEVQRSLLNMQSASDFQAVVGFFESARNVDLGEFGLNYRHGGETVPAHPESRQNEYTPKEMEYGDIRLGANTFTD